MFVKELEHPGKGELCVLLMVVVTRLVGEGVFGVVCVELNTLDMTL